MRRRAATTTTTPLLVLFSVFLLAFSSLYYYYYYYIHNNISCSNYRVVLVPYPSTPNLTINYNQSSSFLSSNNTIKQGLTYGDSDSAVVVDTVAVLFPDWEVLLIVSPAEYASPFPSINNYNIFYYCLYPNYATSPARSSGVLPSTNQTTFKCELPRRNRRRLPILAPILVAKWSNNNNNNNNDFPDRPPPAADNGILMRWNFLAYESMSTEYDVVLLVKGINNRQGFNRAPREFRCVFYYDTAVSVVARTEVTSSVQEVFRCNHPHDPAIFSYNNNNNNNPSKRRRPIRISLEIVEEKLIIPSVAYYYYNYYNKKAAAVAAAADDASPQKSLLCAATMVHNVAKFLKEWVTYHSSIGVDKFILYDNDSDDELIAVVEALKEDSLIEIETWFWIWPKAQEAAFSHMALKANHSCTWIMYVDVDEFVYSPSWNIAAMPMPTYPNPPLKSLLPRPPSTIGQLSIKCYEFGPSNQSSNPVEGVTQGYTCRRKADNRHKSIVLLDALHFSLANAIHHFKLKERRGYKWDCQRLNLDVAVVNHYKYQAWSEFRAKFRRRVSAYVVDWTKTVNPFSQDRAPGLGFVPIEPPSWPNQFCEVKDERLKTLTRKWFRRETELGHYQMAWQL